VILSFGCILREQKENHMARMVFGISDASEESRGIQRNEKIPFRSILLFSLVFLATIAVTSCTNLASGSGGGTSSTYSVTYNGNSQSSGTVPTDSTKYTSGQTVTVLGNTGSLALSGSTFAGWNTKADGSGTSYSTGQAFTMGNADIALYAKWISNSKLIVAGYTTDSSGNNSPCYWQNGSITVPTLPSGTTWEYAGGITLSGSTVYFSGIERTSSFSTIGYIANGTFTSLTPPTGLPTGSVPNSFGGIAVSGGTVYASGVYSGDSPKRGTIFDYGVVSPSRGSTITPTPCYWVNNSPSILPLPSGAIICWTTGIALSGSDIYVAGYWEDSSTNITPCYWKNGTYNSLSLPSGQTGGYTHNISVAGSSIYIAGGTIFLSGSAVSSSTVGYWANGTLSIPCQICHPFRRKVATCSGPKLPGIPA
jgi:hypothetical protein